MYSHIGNPAKCEVRAVIRFLMAKYLPASSIHRELCAVYGQIMSEGVVRRWVRVFKSGRTNIHDEGRSGRPSVVTDELVQRIDEKIRENRGLSISELSEQFPQISRTVFYKVATEKLGESWFGSMDT